ncbi:unnamed protein product [Pleuronectes platessa]|uniref:Uncharacterized protein n=1 Tax=Pleuronectes platessa TaxID=8262 RepID=A0A9N7VSD6_PLEPL|nr:unnamed protein product [Pleuronectes platessa]
MMFHPAVLMVGLVGANRGGYGTSENHSICVWCGGRHFKWFNLEVDWLQQKKTMLGQWAQDLNSIARSDESGFLLRQSMNPRTQRDSNLLKEHCAATKRT